MLNQLFKAAVIHCIYYIIRMLNPRELKYIVLNNFFFKQLNILKETFQSSIDEISNFV